MTVVFFVVNFNADAHLVRFVDSVATARTRAPGSVVKVHVFDNSCKNQIQLTSLQERVQRRDISVEVHSSGRNEGYFGGVPFAQSLIEAGTTSVIYCNPDILLDSDFLLQLEGLPVGGSGVVAPAIVSLDEGFDQNPKYVDRLSLTKLKRLRAIYSTQASFFAFTLLGRLREMFRGDGRGVLRGETIAGEIYAAHGALFIFTDVEFFRRLPPYPCFLFGEELFIAEEARRAGVATVYEPRLRVRDIRHASISTLVRSHLRSYMFESVHHIIDTYYSEDDRRPA